MSGPSAEHGLPDWASSVMSTRLSRRALLRRAAVYGGGVVGFGALSSLVAACSTTGATTAKPLSSQATTKAVASAVTGKGLTPLSLQLNWLENVEFAGILWALSKGYYRDEGIDLTVAPEGPSTDPISLVVSGQADIGMESGGDSVVIARSKGLPVKSFATDLQTDPSAWMTLGSSGITQMSQLRGKTVGLQASDLQEGPLILGLGGLTTSDVTLRTVSFDPSVLVDHEVDAFSVFVTNEPITLEQKGIAVNLIPWSSYGFAFYSDCFFASDSTIAKNPALLKAFVRATQRGWNDVFANPQAAVGLVLQDYGHGTLVEAQQLAELNAQIPLMRTSYTAQNGLLAVSSATWQTGIDLLAKYNLISHSFEASELCAEGFVAA